MNGLQVFLEIVVTIGIVSAQLYFAWKAYLEIQEYKNLFPGYQLSSSDVVRTATVVGEIQEIKTEQQPFKKEFTDLVRVINKYLLKNRGAVDYRIVETMVNRHVDATETSIGTAITLPLYTGLMGTFLGVIIGLLFILGSGFDSPSSIDSFILGIIIAMTASFIGLFTSVANNFVLRSVKNQNEFHKNQFFSFLQTDLLPHLGNSLYDSIEKLRTTLNQFNLSFSQNGGVFDKKFADNIGVLRDSVSSLSYNIEPIIENTIAQKEFLEQLRAIQYNRLAEATIKVFTVMKDAEPNFVEFIKKQKELNESMNQSQEIVTSIKSIMDRVKTFETSINNLGDHFSTSDVLGGRLISRIEQKLSLIERQFDLAEQHGQRTTDEMKNFFEKELSQIQGIIEQIRRGLEVSLDFHTSDNPLHKLHLLQEISAKMDLLSSQSADRGKNYNDRLSNLTSQVAELSTRDVKQSNGKEIRVSRGRSIINRFKSILKFRVNGRRQK
jgi:hypothetical protein